MACTPLAVAPRGGPKYCVDFQARLGAGLDRAAQRIGLHRQLAERDRLAAARPTIETCAVRELEVLLGAFEMLGREPQDLLAHHLRGLVDGVAGHHRAAAGEGAGAPVELVGVAGHHVDVADIDAELVGDDLGEGGEVPLALRADAGRDATLPFACTWTLAPS